jgi:hypothetical protein
MRCVEKYCRSGEAIDDNMAHAQSCWITKATGTHLEYVILISLTTATMVSGTRLTHAIRALPV